MIYLDYAATSFHKPDCVIDAVVNALKSQGNANRGTHNATLSSSRTVYDTRVKLKEFFNGDSASNIIFTSNSTEALNIAINGTIDEGDKVVTTDTEHNSVLRPLYHLQKEKHIDLQFVKADKQGRLDIKDFENIIDDKTKVVVVNHASNLTGLYNDVKKIAEIAHKHNAIIIVDGSQSAGSIKIDVKDLDIDIFCFTGHKSMLGPQGTGGLVIKEGIEVKPFKRGGTGVKTYSEEQPSEYPTRLEAGTLNAHGIAGLNAAIDYLNDDTHGLKYIEKHERDLLIYFYENVKDIDGIKLYGDFSHIYDYDIPHAPILSINIKDYESGEVSDCLSSEYDIATRPGGHCAPRLHIALGTRDQGIVRFSLGYMTTKDDIDKAVIAIKNIAS